MRFSKKRLGQQTRQEIYHNFYQLLADLQTPEEVKNFLTDFLTHAELISLVKRLAIVSMLEENYSYTDIKKSLRVSSATIATVAQMMQKKSRGFTLALKYLEADAWAGKTSQGISSFLRI